MYWLVDKFLSGKASREEVDKLYSWIEEHPANRDDYDDMRLLWQYSKAIENRAISDPDFYAGLDRIKKIIRDNETKGKPEIPYRKIYFLIALLVAFLLIFFYR